MPAVKGTRPPNAGKGRKAGVPNKLTRSVKEAFEHVFKDLQKKPDEPYALGEWAKIEPTEFYKLAAKLIPSEIKADVNATVTPNISLVVEAMTGGKGIIVNTDPVGVNGRKPD